MILDFFTRNIHKTKYFKESTVEMAIYLHETGTNLATLNLHKCMMSTANL